MIRDSTLSARQIVDAISGTVSITIENSKLSVDRPAFELLHVSEDARIRIVNSEVSYKEGLFSFASSSINMQVEGSTLRAGDGSEFGVDVSGSLLLRNSKIASERGGIRCVNGTVAVEQASAVSAKGPALEIVEGSARLDASKLAGSVGVRLIHRASGFVAKGGDIEGTEAAIAVVVPASPTVSVDKKTKVKGRWVGLTPQ